MIEVPYVLLRKTPIVTAVHKLAAATGFNQGILLRLAAVCEEFGKAYHKAHEELDALNMRHLALDSSGNFKKPLEYVTSKETHEADLAEWDDKKIILVKPPFNLHELAPAALTPNDLNALKPFIKEMGA